MSISASRREAAAEEWLGLFLLFSAGGWAWEVVFTGLAAGQWVNRGMLHGPWLPVYGLGGVLLAAALERTAHPWTAPLLGAALGGLTEYAGSLLLERRFGLRWWDYSGWPGNLQGRVCLGSLSLFALAGWALYRLAPALRRRLRRMDPRVRRLLCRAVSLAYALDWSWSLLRPNIGPGITCPP